MGDAIIQPTLAALIGELAARVGRLERGILTGAMPHARMTWSGAVAMTTNTHYAFSASTGLSSLGITGTEQFDSDGSMLDLTTGRIFAPRVGCYLGVLQASWAANATDGPRSVLIRRNQASGAAGTLGGVAGEAASTVGAGNSSSPSASGIWLLNAGACMEPTFYQNIGANLNITSVTFAMVYLSATPIGL